MRIFFFACALIAQGVCTLSAQSISDIVKPNERYHDFGAVPKASKAEHRFSLHNPFNTEIQIQGVRASCGCTTPILETRVIKPGETGYLTAKFNTDRFNGEKKSNTDRFHFQAVFHGIAVECEGLYPDRYRTASGRSCVR